MFEMSTELNFNIRCDGNKCIPFWWKCDVTVDCEDGTDEFNCNNMEISTVFPFPPQTSEIPKVCPANHFQCSNGDCILSSWVCDGSTDCSDNADEMHCDGFVSCTKDQFKCRVDGGCVALSAVCDGHNDCVDSTDEASCDHNTPDIPTVHSCPLGFFPCDGNECFPLAYICDNSPNCYDYSDEVNCTSTEKRYVCFIELNCLCRCMIL